jgi:hypothetical protein
MTTRARRSAERFGACRGRLPPQKLEQINERAALDDQRAVHVEFAEIEVGMQRELQRGERALETDGDIGTRLRGYRLAELQLGAVGSNDR